MEMVELLVRMDCNGGCERKIRKKLAKLKGVDTIDIDARMNKVTVMGYVDRKKVLKAVRNTGKRAEFWPQGLYPHNNPYYYNSNGYDYTDYSHAYNNTNDSSCMSNYPLGPCAFQHTYNYEVHGHNNHHGSLQEETHPFYHAGTGSANPDSSFFSDENPTSCSIM